MDLATLLPINNPTDLDPLARQMYEHIRNNGSPAEVHIILEMSVAFQIILRPGAQEQVQLLAVGAGLYFPEDWREDLKAAFGVPAECRPDFNIIRRYYALKWTWTEVERPQQLALALPGLAEASRANNYKAEL
jgi:hypothetical protein